MKKQVTLVLMSLLMGLSSLMAQGPRQTPEERVKATMEKLVPLGLDKEQTKKTTDIITDFVNAQQKIMEDFRANGGTDREGWMAKRKEMEDTRDGKLKAIFTADQYKKWIDEIVPSMRPQRRN
jgi:hypothetical protein